MINTWPEIQKTAQYFTDNLLVHSKVSVSNGCTYYSSNSKPEMNASQIYIRTFRSRPRQIPLSDEQREKFRKEFERQLWLKLLAKDNWRMEQPEYGRGYRCISIRLLHKRTQLFDRFEKIDNKTSVNKKNSEVFNLMTFDSNNSRFDSTKFDAQQDSYNEKTINDNEQITIKSVSNSSVKTSSHNETDPPKSDFISTSSSRVSSRSNSVGLIDPANLPKLQIHDLGTRVYIDPIIITTFINSIDKNISKLDKSRQYVEVLRYIDESVIDGKHEMMLWLDPGLVEIQHVWLEPRDLQTGNPNSSREEHPRIKSDVIYRSSNYVYPSYTNYSNYASSSNYTSSKFKQETQNNNENNNTIHRNSTNIRNNQQPTQSNSNAVYKCNQQVRLKFTEQVRNAPDELLKKCSG